MRACDFIGGGVNLINDAVTSAEIDPSLQQSRGPENLGCGEDLGLHGATLQIENVKVLVG